jgi:TRAP-type C4-dicarboxylate transport system substrate-binding protein
MRCTPRAKQDCQGRRITCRSQGGSRVYFGLNRKGWSVKNVHGLRSHFYLALACLAAWPSVAGAAGAQEITLRAASALPVGSYFARNFEAFVKKVNDEGKGLVHIHYVGGPEAIPTFELANAIKTGVVDLGNTTTSYTASLVPEGQVLNYTDLTTAEMREDGVMDNLNRIFLQKGLYYYARGVEGMRYYFYMNKPLTDGKLAGLKIRGAPIYQSFFNRMGITSVQLAPGEIYTALENNVVDGYALPLIGIFDFNLQKKTKYRIEPGFYTSELGVIVNGTKWQALTPEQRAFLDKERGWLENLGSESIRDDAPKEIVRQQASGIQVIKLDDAYAATMLKTAYSAAWDSIVALSPTDGPKLRAMMAPK